MVSHQQIESPTAIAAPTTKIYGELRLWSTLENVTWTAEFPNDELTYDGIVMLVPGFGGIKRSSRGERVANAQNGIPCVSYDPARLSWNLLGNLAGSQELHVRTADAVMSAVSKAVRARHDVPNKSSLDPDRFLLSAHSMGGFAATELGLKRPGQVESVVYKASPGFGRFSFDLAGVKDEFDDILRSGELEPTVHNYARFMRYVFGNPFRTAGELLACVSVDNRPKVARLGDIGVNLAYLGFENDTMVPPSQVMSGIQEVVSVTHVMPGVGHLAPWRHPSRVVDEVFILHQQAAA
jgi:pimeloyl-ACP methyl ester carboxylesterase